MDGRAIDTIPEVAPVFAAVFGAAVFGAAVFGAAFFGPVIFTSVFVATEGEAALLAAR